MGELEIINMEDDTDDIKREVGFHGPKPPFMICRD
jgi:hypothetical protein